VRRQIEDAVPDAEADPWRRRPVGKDAEADGARHGGRIPNASSCTTGDLRRAGLLKTDRLAVDYRVRPS
jgi:hypothetical protein